MQEMCLKWKEKYSVSYLAMCTESLLRLLFRLIGVWWWKGSVWKERKRKSLNTSTSLTNEILDRISSLFKVCIVTHTDIALSVCVCVCFGEGKGYFIA